MTARLNIPRSSIGFLGTAWFVVVLVILHYFLGSQSTKNPFSPRPKNGKQVDPEQDEWVPNHVDQLVLRISRWFGKTLFGWLNNTRLSTWLAEKPRWEHAFTKVLLTMCDVQLLTGTGILVSGYISLSSFISAYRKCQIRVTFSSFGLSQEPFGSRGSRDSAAE